MGLNILSPEQWLDQVSQKHYAAQGQYWLGYSTWWGGFVENPQLWMVPMDDHLVHRGDGVFEAIKVVAQKPYLLDAHLARLQSSASRLGISMPKAEAEIKEILQQMVKYRAQKSGSENGLLRLFVSRGPGSFTTNPYESIGSQFYAVYTELKVLPEEKYTAGVRIGRSQVVAKEGLMAQVKSCNYLINVLNKKEAVDRKLDFVVGFDSAHCLTESSTENIAIVDHQGKLVSPRLENILRGTTMMRTFELAQERGWQIEFRDLFESDVLAAQEVMMIGTTLDVLPVQSYESKKWATDFSKSLQLRRWVREDQLKA